MYLNNIIIDCRLSLQSSGVLDGDLMRLGVQVGDLIREMYHGWETGAPACVCRRPAQVAVLAVNGSRGSVTGSHSSWWVVRLAE
jgi:hypothetical protein